MSKKTVLYIHHGKGIGGAPLSLLYLIRGLDKSQYRPIVLFLQESPIIDWYRKEGIQVISPLHIQDQPHSVIRWYRWYHPHLMYRSWRDRRKTVFAIAPKIYDEVMPDIVHLNTSSLRAWAQVAHERNIPVVWHIREPIASGYFGTRSESICQAVRKYSRAIVAISNNDALPWKGDARVHVVHNPVDPQVFNAQKKEFSVSYEKFCNEHAIIKAPTILFLGGLSAAKGTHIIFGAFKKLLRRLPQAQLLVGGYFEKKTSALCNPRYYIPTERYKRQVLALYKQIEPSTRLLGPIEEVPYAMQASDVVVFPATVGHFARPIIEAGFMKKPTIASKLPPLNELIVSNRTGYLVDAQAIDVWVEKMYILLTNPMLRQLMGEHAHEYCSKHFDLHTQAIKVQKVYEQVAY